MNKQTRATRLREAANIISEVANELNLTATTCAHCGHGVFENDIEGRAWQRIGDLPKRLREVALTLESQPDAASRRLAGE